MFFHSCQSEAACLIYLPWPGPGTKQGGTLVTRKRHVDVCIRMQGNMRNRIANWLALTLMFALQVPLARSAPETREQRGARLIIGRWLNTNSASDLHALYFVDKTTCRVIDGGIGGRLCKYEISDDNLLSIDIFTGQGKRGGLYRFHIIGSIPPALTLESIGGKWYNFKQAPLSIAPNKTAFLRSIEDLQWAKTLVLALAGFCIGAVTGVVLYRLFRLQKPLRLCLVIGISLAAVGVGLRNQLHLYVPPSPVLEEVVGKIQAKVTYRGSDLTKLFGCSFPASSAELVTEAGGRIPLLFEVMTSVPLGAKKVRVRGAILQRADGRGILQRADGSFVQEMESCYGACLDALSRAWPERSNLDLSYMADCFCGSDMRARGALVVREIQELQQ